MIDRTICLLIIGTAIGTALNADSRLQLIQGHPVVNGVYINGHGPYRFLLDTGAETNQVDRELACAIGLRTEFRTEMVTPIGSTFAYGGRGIEVRLDSIRAGNEEFLYTDLTNVRRLSAGIQGVMGERFLGCFDYLLDLKNRRLDFGDLEPKGIRVKCRRINGVPSVLTSLGWLVLDSGTDQLVLFGGKPAPITHLLLTATSSKAVGLSGLKSVVIKSQTIARTEAVVIPRRDGSQVDGLLPGRLFRSIYVSNSKGYATLDCSKCFELNQGRKEK